MDNVNEDSRKWFVLAAIGTSTFMSALDTSVVNSVLPVINRSLGSDIATIQWVVTIYLLIVSGLLLSFGRLGDLRGHKPIFLLGFGIFILSSAFCGLASSAGWLITFRGLQALGAAMLAANSPAILTQNFPATQRGQALGLQATMGGSGDGDAWGQCRDGGGADHADCAGEGVTVCHPGRGQDGRRRGGIRGPRVRQQQVTRVAP